MLSLNMWTLSTPVIYDRAMGGDFLNVMDYKKNRDLNEEEMSPMFDTPSPGGKAPGDIEI